jgi:colicin import membrane protein
VNAFLRQHAKPLLRSTLLHVALFAIVMATALLSVVPKLTPPAAIDAYLARPSGPKATPAPPAPAPIPEPPAPAPIESAPPAPASVPDPAAAQAELDRERVAAELAARDARAAQQRRADAARLEQSQVEHAAAERRAVEEREATALRQRREAAAAETMRREAAAAEMKRREAAVAELKRRAADAEARRLAAAEAAQRSARESDLARDLAAEEHRLGAVDAGLLARYVADLRARIERAWNRPASARPGLKCTLFVTQVPGGTVSSVRLGECNGDEAVRQSIVLAVHRASPLPPPPDPSLFERSLNVEFAPHD